MAAPVAISSRFASMRGSPGRTKARPAAIVSVKLISAIPSAPGHARRAEQRVDHHRDEGSIKTYGDGQPGYGRVGHCLGQNDRRGCETGDHVEAKCSGAGLACLRVCRMLVHAACSRLLREFIRSQVPRRAAGPRVIVVSPSWACHSPRTRVALHFGGGAVRISERKGERVSMRRRVRERRAQPRKCSAAGTCLRTSALHALHSRLGRELPQRAARSARRRGRARGCR